MDGLHSLHASRGWIGAACLAILLGTFTTTVHAAIGRTTGNFGVSASGAAQYSIPLWTPPGINGMQPSLALVYSSRGGDGYFGVGWSLSGLSAIHRCRKTWAQDGLNRDVRCAANHCMRAGMMA
ncbi:MAG TPA: SpvB/TcaC N-terminal domain-containing protein [Steroidobacteraceae bacterium]|nr:SpvB/TcaC N-terminal domain-containing protein [Steroidobacteraceae bacterium]